MKIIQNPLSTPYSIKYELLLEEKEDSVTPQMYLESAHSNKKRKKMR